MELKSRFERDAGAHGFSAADVEDAMFAMVALLDQTILSQRGPARDAWIARPLQLELYGRQLAGEEFFERLDKLRQEREARIEALEVYGCCLGFGFGRCGTARTAPWRSGCWAMACAWGCGCCFWDFPVFSCRSSRCRCSPDRWRAASSV
jgi:hypothetical protein